MLGATEMASPKVRASRFGEVNSEEEDSRVDSRVSSLGNRSTEGLEKKRIVGEDSKDREMRTFGVPKR